MFRKKLKEIESLINTKIDDIQAKLDDLIKSIVGRWKVDDDMKIVTYVGYLKTDIGYMDSNNTIEEFTLFRISEHIIEISVFIDFHTVTAELISLFNRAIIKFNTIYTETFGREPTCYQDWLDTIKRYEKRDDKNA